MSSPDFSIVHIVSEPTVRGGENQIKHLIQGSQGAYPHAHHQVLCIEGSAAIDVFKPICPVTTYGGLWSGLWALRRLTRQTTRPILINAHSSKGHSLGYFARLFGFSTAPMIVHRRVDFRPKSARKYRSAHIDQFVAISDFIADVLLDYGIDAAKVATVKSAVNGPRNVATDGEAHERRLALRKEWLGDMPPETPVILNVGYLTEQKDHATLVRAFGHPLLKEQPCVCVIAGSGHLKDKLQQQIDALGARVKLLGLRDDVPDCLAASDIFAMSSAYEGLGTSILDAMHSGLPVAATQVGGIPEMVKDAKTGLLSPPGDSEALASNIARLVKDEALRRTLADTATATILPQFTVEKMVAGNMAVYKKLLDERS